MTDSPMASEAGGGLHSRSQRQPDVAVALDVRRALGAADSPLIPGHAAALINELGPACLGEGVTVASSPECTCSPAATPSASDASARWSGARRHAHVEAL